MKMKKKKIALVKFLLLAKKNEENKSNENVSSDSNILPDYPNKTNLDNKIALLSNQNELECINSTNNIDNIDNIGNIDNIDNTNKMTMSFNKVQNIYLNSVSDDKKTDKISKIFKENITDKPIELFINSSQVTEKECYNDYFIKLSEPIKLRDLNISSINLPKRISDNITEDSNQLEIIINKEINSIILEPNYYNRNEIIENINEAMQQYNLDISVSIDLDSDKFVFESPNKFTLNLTENSILPYLGFTRNSYFNKTKYEAENSLDVGDNIFYLVIENLCEKPMFKINMDIDMSIEKLIEFDNHKDKIIDHLIIKFYKTANSLIKNNLKYSFFFEEEHEINFEFI